MELSGWRDRRNCASRATDDVRGSARKVGSAVAVSSALLVWGAVAATPALGAVPTCDGEAATIVGTRHADRIVGTPRRDVIVAGAGSDRAVGRGGDDLICGGSGDDQLDAGNGTDRVFGGPGRDVLVDTTDSWYDLLRGGSGADVLRSTCCGMSGSGTQKKLAGDAGADRIVSSGYGDELLGGRGDDHLVVRRARAFVVAGGHGQDVLRIPRWGAGLRLVGDGDSVRIDFAPGTFVVFDYSSAPGPVTVDLRAEYGQVVGSPLKDELLGLTDQPPPDSTVAVIGTSGNDTLLGTDFTGTGDVLFGERGDDELRGRDGTERLVGGQGDDLLDGGPGSDDTASGGPGTDTCIDVEFLFDASDPCELGGPGAR